MIAMSTIQQRPALVMYFTGADASPPWSNKRADAKSYADVVDARNEMQKLDHTSMRLVANAQIVAEEHEL